MNKSTLDIKNFSFSYIKNNFVKEPVISIPRLSFSEGEVILITGPSSAGKSTLAKAITGILSDIYPKQMNGEIFLLGENITQLSLSEISKKIGFVQQDPDSQLCCFTVEEEIAFGLENLCYPSVEIKQKIDQILTITNINHLRDRETTKLSGGEKQRVILASILAISPKILILDEPTANLDPEATDLILSLLRALKRDGNRTIIIIEHKLRKFLPIANRLLIMDNGQIKEDIKIKESALDLNSIKKHNIRPLRIPNDIKIRNNNNLGKVSLNIKNLSFFYDSKQILSNVNLSVREREIIGIIGPNGSGKTTLLNIINGLLSPKNKDSIIFQNKRLNKKSTAKRAKDIGTVFQNPNLQMFERTVLKELLFAVINLGLLTDEMKIKANNALEKTFLSRYKSRTPFALSFGEKKRLTVLSAILHKPNLILLDEPFIGQDYENTLNIIELLRDFWSIIIVSHDPELLSRICDRILFIEEGKIIIDDEPTKVFNHLKAINSNSYLPPDYMK